MSVNNGRRVEVSLTGFTGQAGLVELEDRDVISFPVDQKPIHVLAGERIVVDGLPRTVISIAPSPYLRNFKVLELEK